MDTEKWIHDKRKEFKSKLHGKRLRTALDTLDRIEQKPVEEQEWEITEIFETEESLF